jgi:putative resolvase
MNVSDKTAFRWCKAGRLDVYQLNTGTIIVRDPLPEAHTPNGIALYARVSTQGQKANLDRQVERLKTYAASRGYQVMKIVQEIASGMNDTRPKLLKLLTDPQSGKFVVERRDRLTRFGFHYLETLLETQGRKIEVVNVAENAKEDLMADLVAIISSFTARLYGQRRAKRQTERIMAELQKKEEEDATR